MASELLNISGNVFNIQRFSLQDGPGIRTTVFMKGCPLSCIWCHNPEGLSAECELSFDVKKCIGCGECAKICPVGAHVMRDGVHIIERERCTSCMRCVGVCPSRAIEQAGRIMSAREVIDELMKDKAYYKENGGVTLSGGEPLLQPEFSKVILAESKKRGISTAVETSGFADKDVFMSVASLADIILFDLKLCGNEEHKKYTGVSREKIDINLKAAADAGIPVILRCPIIPTVNDNIEHFEGIVSKAKTVKTLKEVHIEPYHTVGLAKHRLIGTESLFETEPLCFERAGEIADLISKKLDVPVKVSK